MLNEREFVVACWIGGEYVQHSYSTIEKAYEIARTQFPISEIIEVYNGQRRIIDHYVVGYGGKYPDCWSSKMRKEILEILGKSGFS